jgi:Flp pilus assembly protein TadG
MLVEAAIIMSLLFTLTFGALQYCYVFLKLSQVQNAAREGARIAVLPSTTSNTAVTNRIETLMADAGMPQTSSAYTVSTYVNGAGTTADVSTATSGQPIKLVIAVSYANVQAFGASLVPTPTTLHATVTMTKEGP